MNHLKYIEQMLDDLSKHPNVTVTEETNLSPEKIRYLKGYFNTQNKLFNPKNICFSGFFMFIMYL